MNWTQADVAAHNAKVGRKLGPGDRDAIALGIRRASPAAERESAMHDQITTYLREKGWLYYHGSTAAKTHRTKGENDFHVLLPGGLVVWVEVKTDEGKLSADQRIIEAWMQKHGHKLHTVRSVDAFKELMNRALTLVEPCSRSYISE